MSTRYEGYDWGKIIISMVSVALSGLIGLTIAVVWFGVLPRLNRLEKDVQAIATVMQNQTYILTRDWLIEQGAKYYAKDWIFGDTAFQSSYWHIPGKIWTQQTSMYALPHVDLASKRIPYIATDIRYIEVEKPIKKKVRVR